MEKKAIAWDKARWAFAAGVTLLVVCAITAGVLLLQIQGSNRRVMHAFSIQVALEDLESTLAAAGRSRTLYNGDPNPAYIKQTEDWLQAAQSQLDTLLHETSSIPAHHDSYAQLASLATQRMDIIRKALLDAEKGHRDAATQDAYTRQIVEVADDLKTSLQDLESHEEEFADQGRVFSERLFTAIVWVLAIAFAAAIGLVLLNYRLLLGELAERRRAERFAIESQETLRLLSVRLIRTQDDQSRKFSRELHDSLGQYLSLAKMNLARYVRTSAQPAELVKETIELLEQSIAETRTISYLLHPPLLDDMGLLFAARWYIEGFAERSGIQVKAHIPNHADRLPLAVEIALFRVLQECLVNIHRHSGSKSAEVSLAISSSEAVLQIRDFGRGIPGQILRQFRENGGRVGVGMAGMRERIREQSGRFEVQSTPNGTMVTAHLPITAGVQTPQMILSE